LRFRNALIVRLAPFVNPWLGVRSNFATIRPRFSEKFAANPTPRGAAWSARGTPLEGALEFLPPKME